MTHFWNDCATYYKNNKERFIQWYDMKNCVSHDLPHCDYNSIFGSVCVLFLEQQNLRFFPLSENHSVPLRNSKPILKNHWCSYQTKAQLTYKQVPRFYIPHKKSKLYQKEIGNVKSILYITLLIALQFTKYTEKHFCHNSLFDISTYSSQKHFANAFKIVFQNSQNKVHLLHKATTLVELLGSWSARQTQTKIHEEKERHTLNSQPLTAASFTVLLQCLQKNFPPTQIGISYCFNQN